MVLTLLHFMYRFIKINVLDIALRETDFHVTVTVLNNNHMPMVQGWVPLTPWYRVEDGTKNVKFHRLQVHMHTFMCRFYRDTT
jgi:hypothetical protein